MTTTTKSQTPETDAERDRIVSLKLSGWPEWIDFARKLELGRDEARIFYLGLQKEHIAVVEERNQLRKVCAAISEMDIPANDVHPNVLQEFYYKCKELAQAALKPETGDEP
jgi:hypothetical protein